MQKALCFDDLVRASRSTRAFEEKLQTFSRKVCFGKKRSILRPSETSARSCSLIAGLKHLLSVKFTSRKLSLTNIFSSLWVQDPSEPSCYNFSTGTGGEKSEDAHCKKLVLTILKAIN